MSEINEPTVEELNEDIEVEVETENYVPTPVDPTLQNEGEAADAKATGEAIAGVLNNATINNKSFSNKTLVLYGTDIKVDNSQDAKTLQEALEDANGKTADDITYDPETLQTIAGKFEEVDGILDADFTAEEAAELITEVFDGGDE